MNPQDSGSHKNSDSQPELTICIDLPNDQGKRSKLRSSSKPNSPEWLENFRQRRLVFKPKKVMKNSFMAKCILKYEELVKYICQYQHFCEENKKTFPMKSLTPNCVWFMLSALYFNRSDYILRDKTPELLIQENMKAVSALNSEIRDRLQEKDLAENSISDDLFLAEIKRHQTRKEEGLDEIIESLEEELDWLKAKNNENIRQIKEKLEAEFNYLLPIIEYSNKSPFNILVDLDNTSRREKEFFDYLESKQQDPRGFTLESLRTTNNSKMLEPHDVVCQICNDGDFTDDNLIVYCSLCNVTVHQKCYELLKIPENDWICDLCLAFGPSKAQNMRCPLCSRRGGAMKPTAFPISECIFESYNLNFHDFQINCLNRIPEEIIKIEEDSNKMNFEETKEEPIPKEIWVHLSCALWIPEIYFDESLKTNNIRGLNVIEDWRFSMSCGVCRMKKIGAIVQCAGFKCSSFYHVECARRVGMYLEIIDLKYLLYCDKHIPLKLKRVIVARSFKARDEILKYFKNLKKMIYAYKYENELKYGTKNELGNDIFSRDRCKKLNSSKFIVKLKKIGEEFKVTAVKYPYNKDFVQKQFNLRKIERNNFEKPFLHRDNKTKNLLRNNMKNVKFIKTTQRKKEQVENKKLKTKKIYNDFPKKLKLPKKKQLLAKKKSNFVRKSKTKNEKNEPKIDPIPQLAPKIHEIFDEEPEKIMIDLCNQENFTRNVNKFNESSDVEILECFPNGFSHKNIDEILNGASNPEKLYCICQRRYDGRENMMCCLICEEWFHFKCIGFQGTIKDAENVKFVCKSCDFHENLQSRVNRRTNYQDLFENYYDDIEELKLNNGKSVLQKLTSFPVKQMKNKSMKKNLGYNILKKWGSQQDKEYQDLLTREIENFSEEMNDLENIRKFIKIQ